MRDASHVAEGRFAGQVPNLQPRIQPSAQRRWLEHLALRVRKQSNQNQTELRTLQQQLYTSPTPFPARGGQPLTSDSLSAPSAVLEGMFFAALKRQQQTEEQDISRLDLVARRLEGLAAELSVDVVVAAQLVVQQGQLLLIEPATVRQRLDAVRQFRAWRQAARAGGSVQGAWPAAAGHGSDPAPAAAAEPQHPGQQGGCAGPPAGPGPCPGKGDAGGSAGSAAPLLSRRAAAPPGAVGAVHQPASLLHHGAAGSRPWPAGVQPGSSAGQVQCPGGQVRLLC
ncbi:hypothetical protein V8C86DRAFT_2852394 [Haematococcus lacustris]